MIALMVAALHLKADSKATWFLVAEENGRWHLLCRDAVTQSGILATMDKVSIPAFA